MDVEWNQPNQHGLQRSLSNLSDGWDYSHPPPFEPRAAQPSSSTFSKPGGESQLVRVSNEDHWEDSEDDGLLSEEDGNGHWAENILDGNYPLTRFRYDYHK